MESPSNRKSDINRSHLFLTIYLLISGGFLLTVLIKNHVYDTQRDQLLADQAAIAFENEFRDRILFLEILKNGWTATDDPEKVTDENRFNLKISAVFEEIPGITAISFINTSGVIIFRYPQSTNDSMIGKSICINKDGSFNTAFDLANTTRNMTISSPKMLQINNMGYVIYCPLIYDESIIGFLNMVFISTIFVENYLQDQPLLDDYEVQICDNGTLIYNDCDNNETEVKGIRASTFEVLGRTWEIYINSHQHSLFNLSSLLIFSLWFLSVAVAIFYERSLEKRNFSLQKAIQDKAETEKKLRQAAKMEAVGRLAGGIAHDFNNILTAIQGFAELALLDLDEPSSLKENLKEIQLAENRAANLVRQLLTFSRKQVIQPKAFDLNQHLSSMNSLLMRLIREDVDLVMHIDLDHEMLLFADPVQIETVIINLVANARDATTENGKIIIETSYRSITDQKKEAFTLAIPVGDYVLLSVSDNGIGMSQETKNHLFEPYFTTKDVEKGTGLGLSTVFGIVNQNQGYIDIYSEIGEGSTFSIYFPRCYLTLAEIPSKIHSEQEKAFPYEGNKHGKILIVEDDPSVKKIINQAISKAGYHMLNASDGMEALQIASQHGHDIDLLISDMIMPKMNGKDLAKHILRDFPNIDVLFISGYANKFLSETELLDEKSNFLQKPFTMEELLIKVHSILNPS
ncbi:MAG: response regulator [Promethearchaeota archaeon]